MPQYLLSMYQPDGAPPAPDVLSEIMGKLDVMNADLLAAGAWVFTGGLHPPSASTVVRFADGEVLMTDGPFAEGKEHIGGFWVIDVPDLDDALRWAGRAAEATTLPTEVRPFRERPAS
jgi:hypothetical protein